MNKILKGFLLISAATYFSACDNSSSKSGGPNIASDKIRNAANPVSATMESVAEAIQTGITNAQFTLVKPAVTPTPNPTPQEEDFQCNEAGNTEALPTDEDFAMKSLYCRMTATTTTEVALMGPLQMSKSFVCSLGELTFDGLESSKTITVDTTCFPQAFVDQVVGTPETPTEPNPNPTQENPEPPAQPDPATQFDVQVTAVDLKALDEIGLPTEAGWTELVQIKLPDKLKEAVKGNGYTVLTKSEDDEKAVAIYKDLALQPGGDMGSESFAAYTKSGDEGVVTVESRQAPSLEAYTKHWRLHLTGVLNPVTSRMVSVASSSIIAGNGATTEGSTSADYISLQGNATEGRLVVSDKTSETGWSENVEGVCYGPTTATCAGNEGLKPTKPSDMAFFYQNGSYTNSYQWFINNSYLEDVADELTFDDIQPEKPEEPTPPTEPEEPVETEPMVRR